MNTPVSYGDIPKDERNRLARDAFRLKPKLRGIQFSTFLSAFLFSSMFTDEIWPKGNLSTFLARLAVHVVMAVVLNAIIWGVFGHRRLKTEVENIKNA
jgi:uncharacterized membrane protein